MSSPLHGVRSRRAPARAAAATCRCTSRWLLRHESCALIDTQLGGTSLDHQIQASECRIHFVLLILSASFCQGGRLDLHISSSQYFPPCSSSYFCHIFRCFPLKSCGPVSKPGCHHRLTGDHLLIAKETARQLGMGTNIQDAAGLPSLEGGGKVRACARARAPPLGGV